MSSKVVVSAVDWILGYPYDTKNHSLAHFQLWKMMYDQIVPYDREPIGGLDGGLLKCRNTTYQWVFLGTKKGKLHHSVTSNPLIILLNK